MPVFNFKCLSCGDLSRRLLPHLSETKICLLCGATLERVSAGPTTKVIEVRDNGFMPKQVEQLANLDELKSTKPPDSGTV